MIEHKHKQHNNHQIKQYQIMSKTYHSMNKNTEYDRIPNIQNN